MSTAQHLGLGLRLLLDRRDDDRGEGVISAAIAVLIMAFIGALMWVGFNEIWNDAEENTKDCVAQIGVEGTGGCAPAG